MRRSFALLFIVASFCACGRKPCDEDEVPQVRLDVSVGRCNFRPLAEIRAKRSVPKGSIVQLDASESSDQNGDELKYRWTLVSVPNGSSAVISASREVRASFVADRAGTYAVQLI